MWKWTLIKFHSQLFNYSDHRASWMPLVGMNNEEWTFWTLACPISWKISSYFKNTFRDQFHYINHSWYHEIKGVNILWNVKRQHGTIPHNFLLASQVSHVTRQIRRILLQLKWLSEIKWLVHNYTLGRVWILNSLINIRMIAIKDGKTVKCVNNQW